MRHLALATIITAAGLAHAAPADASGACYRYVRSDAQRRLVHRESRGDPRAQNEKSSAFGCLQLIRANRVTFAKRLGVNPDTTDPRAQMRMGSMYIDQRFGSDDRALAFHLQNGWF